MVCFAFSLDLWKLHLPLRNSVLYFLFLFSCVFCCHVVFTSVSSLLPTLALTCIVLHSCIKSQCFPLPVLSVFDPCFTSCCLTVHPNLSPVCFSMLLCFRVFFFQVYC